MISAIAAWHIAMPAMESKYQKFVKELDKHIIERSKAGYTYTSYNLATIGPEQDKRLMAELKEAGYRVKYILGGLLEIYWDKEEKE